LSLASFLPDREDFRALLRLALPVVVVQVGMMTMGVVDTVMMGRVSAVGLAAVALGHLYVFGVLIFGLGTLMALDPVVAQAVGGGDREAVARAVQRGLLKAVGLAAFSSLLMLPARPVLGLLGQPEEVVPLAAAYTLVSIPGAFPFLAFVVLRQSLQAMGRMAPIVITIVLANIINAILNWALIFGHLGSPPLGAVGAGWASTFSRWAMAILMLVIARHDLAPLLRPLRPEALHLRPLGRMLRIGLPIGAHFTLEYSAFTVVALLMGRLGAVQMAAHQVAINLASLTFMVPLGIAGAAAVLVGHAIGRGDPDEARRAAAAALLCGTAFMTTTAALFLSGPGLLARLYTTDAGVMALAALLIPIAGVFQVFDGLQVVGAGILRGIGDTRAPLVVSILGFWLIGLPISIYLGFHTGAGPVGLWWGLVAGLAAVAAFLLLRIRNRMGRELRRLVIES
jgi:multidrug resistance protein, MATE family